MFTVVRRPFLEFLEFFLSDTPIQSFGHKNINKTLRPLGLRPSSALCYQNVHFVLKLYIIIFLSNRGTSLDLFRIGDTNLFEIEDH